MSGHSASARHQQQQATDGTTEVIIEQIKSVVIQLKDVLASCPANWQPYLPSAKSAITALDSMRFFRDTQRFAEQMWILQGLQDFAFHDVDAGCIQDITAWCSTSWLRMLRNYPENVDVLSGLGQNWLQRSQATLATIHREEGDESSSSGSGHGAAPDRRKQGALYMEVRGSLQPAVDFYARAVKAADDQGVMTGPLLASAAEAQMSLGNVTASPSDEGHFTQAILYLRRTETIAGYRLSPYLQQYLDDYGRFVA